MSQDVEVLCEKSDQFAKVTMTLQDNSVLRIDVESVEGDFMLCASSGTLAMDMYRHPFAYRRPENAVNQLQEVSSEA